VATFDHLFMAALTRNDDDAGTSSRLNLTVNVDGEDIVDGDMGGDVWPVNFPHLGSGEAGIGGLTLSTPFNSNDLTNSSIRLGIRGDNAWGPQHVLLFGVNFAGGPSIALAMETDLPLWLSTDPSDGGGAHLTMPLRLVSPGGSNTLIRRVLMLVETQDLTPGAGTDSPIQLEIIAGGNPVLRGEIDDTTQTDLEGNVSNWYPFKANVPFTRGDVLSNGRITLSIKGKDAWLPGQLFLFGLDTLTGRPNEVVNLVSMIGWNLGWLSEEPGEGAPSQDLPVVSV
jgi:hypothetical protein